MADNDHHHANSDEKKPLDPEKGSYEQAVFTKEVDAVQVKGAQGPEFIGLTKEELERYRDDPFWKRLRLFLFVLFWVAWIVMFVAAIVIVIISPKCPPKVIPHWWQSKLSYQIWTESFKDSDGDGVGDINGLNDQLDSLKKAGVQTIWPVQLLESMSFTGYQVSNFKNVDSRLGSNDDLKKLISAAHGKIPKMFVLMDFPTTTSTVHEWFKKSAANDSDFDDFYVWSDSNPNDPQYYSEMDGRWYFHMEETADSPVLNWASSAVREKMGDVLQYWLGQGIDGFYIGHVQYMSGEKPSNPNWDQTYTYVESLSSAAEAWKNETGNEDQQLVLFTSLDSSAGAVAEQVIINLVEQGGLQYVINDDLKTIDSTDVSTLAKTISERVETRIGFHKDNNETWPMWELGNPYTSRVSTRLGSRALGELMNLVLLMLPGSINNYYGDPIGMVDSNSTDPELNSKLWRSPMQWDDSLNAGFSTSPAALKFPVNGDYSSVNFQAQYSSPGTPLKMFRRLAKLRQTDDTFLNGNLTIGPEQGNLLTLGRFPTEASGSKVIYLAAINFDDSNNGTAMNVDFKQAFPGLENEEGAVLTMTSGATQFSERDTIDHISKVSLGPLQGLVVKLTG